MKLKRLLKSFRDASKGVKYVFLQEQNFRLQLIAATVVIVFMFVFDLRKSEMIVVLLLILSVLILELLNSTLEKFVDLLKPRLHYQVEVVKDIMAAMVFVASLGALIVGTIIFWPYLVDLIKVT
jgi:undecaprenol kinase